MPLKTMRDEPLQMNLTPMIDVLFLLIIFFMVGTNFVEDERKIQLQVPSVTANAQLDVGSQKKVVGIDREGRVTLDGVAMSLPALTEALAGQHRQNPQLSVSIRGDAEGAFQHVASALSACRAAGVRDMAISVKMR